VPSQCAQKACGLIFDVHGYTMSGPVQEQNTNLARLGREKSYVVVQPSAPNASWTPDTDYSVVVDFMKLAMEVWHIEKRRVHFTGFSQGGRMTWTMRCTQSKTIASAAPIAMSSVTCDSGMPEREMPVLYTQGEADEFVGQGEGKNVADAYISSHKMREDKVIASDSQYTWTRYVNDDGLIFEFIYHKYTTSVLFGAGHCFPGSFTPTSPYACTQSVPFHFGEVVMDFFIAHPMK
jgi:poly(3-hydroxybutyrate) depolymerase